ncbi:uncharacterized protein ATNIH1004_010918 [Aspergillus tanneri]|uniref:DUF7730 domain-containing protein n=1 Tax=Aspergillus tanneri TaxID=1220188 RepID=A0A5M9MBT3_9EURO|nr:uncharacterized protein ATNIH1004_010918 [Aspergillus tanneri]KAA8641979.1 hypothetical protein ATNIH1004_010918 [Aspergillus tanneri]
MAFRLFYRLFHRTPYPDRESHQRREPAGHPQPTTPCSPSAPFPFNNVPNWSRAVLESVGIDISTCQVNGDHNKARQLPIVPPDYRCLAEDQGYIGCEINLQPQSLLFSRLPLEVRDLIYFYVLGNRRIHVDYDFHPRKGQWRWWYRICDDPQHCPDKSDPFVCPEYAGAEEAMLELGSNSWVKPGFEYKLHAVSWLTCCSRAYQESLAVLYRSNCFVLTHGIDQLFRFSRVMPKFHLSLITSMSIEIDIYRVSRGPPNMEDSFQEFYNAFFEILKYTLPSINHLRLSIVGLPNRGNREIQWLEDSEWKWIGPWESLCESHDWKLLEIAIPRTWFSDFEDVVQRRSKLAENKRYRLVMGVDLYPRGW